MNIILQVSDRQWTMQAAHLASALARNTGANLLLLQLMRVSNAGLLGTGIGVDAPSGRNVGDLKEIEAVAEDYGVPLVVQPMEYESLTEAAVQAVAVSEATSLFIHLPEHRFTFWRQYQIRRLQRRLDALHCRLYLCDQVAQREPWMPMIHLPAMKHQ